jgi:hypothetical protein
LLHNSSSSPSSSIDIIVVIVVDVIVIIIIIIIIIINPAPWRTYGAQYHSYNKKNIIIAIIVITCSNGREAGFRIP